MACDKCKNVCDSCVGPSQTHTKARPQKTTTPLTQPPDQATRTSGCGLPGCKKVCDSCAKDYKHIDVDFGDTSSVSSFSTISAPTPTGSATSSRSSSRTRARNNHKSNDSAPSSSEVALAQATAKIDQLEDIIRTQKELSSTRENEIAMELRMARETIEDYDKQILAKEEQLRSAETACGNKKAALQARIVELEADLKNQESGIAFKQQALIQQLDSAKSESASKLAAVEAKVVELEGNLKTQQSVATEKEQDLTRQLRSAESTASTRLRDKAVLEARIVELEEGLRSQKSNFAVKERELSSKLRSAENTYNDKKEAMKKRIADLERSLRTQESSSASQERSLSSQLEQAKRTIASLEKSVRDVEGQLSSKSLEYERTFKKLQDSQRWTQSPVSRHSSIQVTQYQSPQQYLKSAPISGQIRAVKFIITSHDQGWSSYPSDHGSYRNTWTWFEVAIISPNGQSITVSGDKILCRNRHAKSNSETKTLIFEKSGLVRTGENLLRPGDPVPKVKPWVDSLKPGYRVALQAYALYPGWVNTVESAEIFVYTAPE